MFISVQLSIILWLVYLIHKQLLISYYQLTSHKLILGNVNFILIIDGDEKSEKKKKVGFKEKLEEYDNEEKEKSSPVQPTEKEKPKGKTANTGYLAQVYDEIQLETHIKNVWSDLVDKHMLKWKEKIDKEDGFYSAPKGEQNLKGLIYKWNADITRNQLLNKLVKPSDTVKTKNEIQQNLKQLNQNPENFRISNGFQGIASRIGSDKIGIFLKDKQLQEAQVRSRRTPTPTYTQRKQALHAEWESKMKDTQNLIEKVSKTRKTIKANQRSKSKAEATKQNLLEQKKQEMLQKQEAEKEEKRQKKLQEIEARRKRNEEEKEKQLQAMKEYQKKFIR